MVKLPLQIPMKQERPGAARKSWLLFASLLQFLLFFFLARWVHKHKVNRFDIELTQRLQKRDHLLFKGISRYLRILCAWPLVSGIVAYAALRLWEAHRRLEAAIILSTTVMEAISRSIFQHVVDRPRPDPSLVHVVNQKKSPSFPSGHATTALADWGWLFLLSATLLKGQALLQKALLSGIALIIVLAGPSRVYTGEHWTTDTVGGYFYGGGWLSLSYYLYLTLKDRGVLAEPSGQQ